MNPLFPVAATVLVAGLIVFLCGVLLHPLVAIVAMIPAGVISLMVAKKYLGAGDAF